MRSCSVLTLIQNKVGGGKHCTIHSIRQKKNFKKTIKILISACKFSIPFSIHFLWYLKENLSNNQLKELLEFAVILMALIFDLRVILYGEIRYISLSLLE